MSKINYPFGAAQSQTLTYEATVAIEVENAESMATLAMTGAATINASTDANVPDGANLTLKVSADGTNRVLTFGTGFLANAFTVTANKSFALTFKKIGGTWTGIGTLQLN